MLVSTADSMPAVSQPGAFLSQFRTRARATAIAAAEGLLQARCGLGGHSMALKFEKTRVSLQCMSCGRNTSGWTIQLRVIDTSLEVPNVVECRGDR